MKAFKGLVFAGGGAKGLGHLGSVRYLANTGVLPEAEAFAGSSIGSLFATLACMFASSKVNEVERRAVFRWLQRLIVSNTFSERVVIDGGDTDPLPGFVRLDGCRLGKPAKPEHYQPWLKSVPHPAYGGDEYIGSQRLRQIEKENALGGPANDIFEGVAAGAIAKDASEALQLADLHPWAAQEKFEDFGGFVDGFGLQHVVIYALKEVQRLLKLGVSAHRRWVTFAEFEELTGRTLALTGFNVLNNQLVTFSGKTTPKFFVADAIRISSSFPIFFRPVYITKEEAQLHSAHLSDPVRREQEILLTGLYMDGGTSSNAPVQSLMAVNPNLPRGAVCTFTFAPREAGYPDDNHDWWQYFIGLIPDDAGENLIDIWFRARFTSSDETHLNPTTSPDCVTIYIDTQTPYRDPVSNKPHNAKVDTFSFDMKKHFGAKAKTADSRFNGYLDAIGRQIERQFGKLSTSQVTGRRGLRSTL